MHTENPAATDGFAFVEYASPDPVALQKLFAQLGFTPVAKHQRRAITRWQQGQAQFYVNEEPGGFAANFAKAHGPCACAMGFRVADAKAAFDHCVKLGAVPVAANAAASFPLPAIYGIGDLLLYFVDAAGEQQLNQQEFAPIPGAGHPAGIGLQVIDHLTHNVQQGRMDYWYDFYKRLFNFREIRYFDIKGQKTGLVSRALTSPCGKIRIPINESADDKSQIAEYLRQYQGEGIQHIALSTGDIYATVEGLRKNGVPFMDVPETYYELIDKRLPQHGEDLARMQKNKILIDGVSEKNELLLQIFTNTVIGPIFFEIIQRKGNDGFGEGNFKALFESIELDQMRRGVI